MLMIMRTENGGAEVYQWVMEAIHRVHQLQPELWDWNLSERTRVAEIMFALRESKQFIHGEWNIDAEWNKEGRGGDSKGLPLNRSGNGVPDLVVHHRGLPGAPHNLLVLEFKNSYRKFDHERDVMKVRQWMERFDYEFGMVVAMGRRPNNFDPVVTWAEWSPAGELEEFKLLGQQIH